MQKILATYFIVQSLNKNKLPQMSQIFQYFDIIESQKFLTNSKVVFVLKIPFIEPEWYTYTFYRLYPIPV